MTEARRLLDGDVYVVGVDGCLGGWVAVSLAGTSWSAEVFDTFEKLVQSQQDAQCLGVDIPIGLTHGGVRACDTAARKILGNRHVCVFNPPDPRALAYTERVAASEFLHGLGVSRIGVQTWAIVPKIAEVDAFMTPDLQDRIFEVHPEVSFAALNDGNPFQTKKSRTAGYEQRAELLRRELGIEIGSRSDLRRDIRLAKPDDVLDAIVAAWSARRHARGVSKRLPTDIVKNERGLRMEIVY